MVEENILKAIQQAKQAQKSQQKSTDSQETPHISPFLRSSSTSVQLDQLPGDCLELIGCFLCLYTVHSFLDGVQSNQQTHRPLDHSYCHYWDVAWVWAVFTFGSRCVRMRILTSSVLWRRKIKVTKIFVWHGLETSSMTSLCQKKLLCGRISSR